MPIAMPKKLLNLDKTKCPNQMDPNYWLCKTSSVLPKLKCNPWNFRKLSCLNN